MIVIWQWRPVFKIRKTKLEIAKYWRYFQQHSHNLVYRVDGEDIDLYLVHPELNQHIFSPIFSTNYLQLWKYFVGKRLMLTVLLRKDGGYFRLYPLPGDAEKTTEGGYFFLCLIFCLSSRRPGRTRVVVRDYVVDFRCPWLQGSWVAGKRFTLYLHL